MKQTTLLETSTWHCLLGHTVDFKRGDGLFYFGHRAKKCPVCGSEMNLKLPVR